MMKWILAIMLFVSAAATAQIGLRDDSTKYIRYQYQYGSRMPRFWADSALHMPYFDTAVVKPQKAGAIMMHLDKNVYKWNGGGWEVLGSGSSGPPSLTYKRVAYGGIGGVLSPGEDAYMYDSITNTLTVDNINLNGGTASRPLKLNGSKDIISTQIDLASSNDVTGNLPVTNLNSGTSATSSTFWRGDGTWATPAGGDITSNVFKDSSFVPLIVFFGESNAAGDGDNANASAGEIDADPRVQIIQSAGTLATLDISSSNNFAVSAGRHGWELELQNQIAARFNNRTVYLVKAGVAGTSIAQWVAGQYLDTFTNRMNNALARINEMGKIPVICGWYSQGINDGVAGTNETTWYNLTLALFNTIRNKYGFFPIIMTQLIGDRTTYPQLDAIDNKIIQIAADRNNYVYRVPTPQGPIGGASTDSIIAGGIHWSYLGLKAIANRMLNAMMDTAGYINYDRRIKNVADYTWRTIGNNSTSASTNFIGTTDANNLVFKTNNTESFRIDNSQKVGIGVVSPTRLLDVNGDIRVNGQVIGNGASGHISNAIFSNDGMPSNTGTNNTGMGYGALSANGSASFNTAFGCQALNASNGNANTALGFQTGIGVTSGTFNVILGSQAGGSWLTTQSNKLVIHNGGAGALIYGDMSTGQLQINSASTPSLTASAAFEIISTTRGFLTPVMTAAQRVAIGSPATGLEVFDTDSLRKMMYNGSAWKAVAWTTDVAGGADGNGIYGGNGSLPSSVTVTGDNNSLTLNDIFAFRINSDYNVIAKANGTGIYSEAIVGAGNIYEIGFTPTAGVFSKGAGVFIDSNNNVGIGTSPPTAMPLYATGASLFVQGLQSNQGNFNRVDNVTTTGNIGLTNYFITIDATAGNVTLTLPAASTAFGNLMGIKYKFQRIDASGNTVTIQRAGSDTINGGTSFTLGTQWETKELQCTSTSTWAQY